jgi:hypothetical protein
MTPEKAKALMAGDLGEEMEKFPLRFCKPAYFGSPPSPEHPTAVKNGTVALIRKAGVNYAVTCAHVIAQYREELNSGLPNFFAIGNCHLSPLDQLVAEAPVLDVAVVTLTEAQAGEIIHGSNGIGEAFFDIGNGIAENVRSSPRPKRHLSTLLIHIAAGRDNPERGRHRAYAGGYNPSQMVRIYEREGVPRLAVLAEAVLACRDLAGRDNIPLFRPDKHLPESDGHSLSDSRTCFFVR